MKLWQSSGVALALLAGVVSANAVTYTLTFSGASWDSGSPPVGTPDAMLEFGGILTLETTGPITSQLTTAGDSCGLDGAAAPFLSCGGAHVFDPNGYNTGFNFLGFQYGETGGPSGGTGFLWFAPGSFTTEGAHQIYTGTITNGSGSYGNFASAGTLMVSGVPEPSAVLMLLAGLGVVGGLARRRV